MVYLLAFCIFGFLLYRFPAMRKATLVVGGLAVLLVAGLILSDKASERAAKSLIPASQLDISNLKLASDYGMYKLTGEIRNKSSHKLTGLTLSVNAYDCPGATIVPTCDAIGEDKSVYVFVDIPAGQVRAIDSAMVTLSNMPTVKGQFLWSFAVEETRGQD